MSSPLLMPPLHPAGAVGCGAGAAIGAGGEGVVVLSPGHGHPCETRADLEALGRGQRQGDLGQIGIQLVEHRLAQSGGHPSGHAFDYPAQRVAVAAGCFDGLGHGLGVVGRRAAGGVGLHISQSHRSEIDVGSDGAHLANPGQHLDVGRGSQELAGDGPGRHPPDGLSGASPPAALPIADAVLGLGGVVGVGGAVDILEVFIRAGPGIGVAHQHGNGRPERLALEHPGEDLHPVGLISQGREPALTRAAAIQVVLDHLRSQRQPGRAAIHHRPNAAPMRLPKRRNPEQPPRRTAHCVSTLQTGVCRSGGHIRLKPTAVMH